MLLPAKVEGFEEEVGAAGFGAGFIFFPVDRTLEFIEIFIMIQEFVDDARVVFALCQIDLRLLEVGYLGGEIEDGIEGLGRIAFQGEQPHEA